MVSISSEDLGITMILVVVLKAIFRILTVSRDRKDHDATDRAKEYYIGTPNLTSNSINFVLINFTAADHLWCWQKYFFKFLFTVWKTNLLEFQVRNLCNKFRFRHQ